MEDQIGLNLRDIRDKLNLTQLQLATELGVSRGFLNYVENGKRDLSESLLKKIEEMLAEIPEETSRLEDYKKGRNFAKIIETLRSQGYSLTQLREDFKCVGTELSYMYIGLKPIKQRITDVLEEKYEINVDYISKGKKTSMFLESYKKRVEIPYFKNFSITDAIQKFEKLDFNGIDLIQIQALDKDIEAFIDISGDNLFPTFQGNEKLGIVKIDLSPALFGKLFIIKYKNALTQIRRVFAGTNKNVIETRKEDSAIIPQIIPLKEIERFYLIRSVYKSDFE